MPGRPPPAPARNLGLQVDGTPPAARNLSLHGDGTPPLSALDGPALSPSSVRSMTRNASSWQNLQAYEPPKAGSAITEPSCLRCGSNNSRSWSCLKDGHQTDSSVRLVCHRCLCRHPGTCSFNALSTFARNFAAGFGFRLTINSFFWLIGAIQGRRSQYTLRTVVPRSFSHFFSLHAVQWGMAIGTTMGGFKAMLCLLRWLLVEDTNLHTFVAAYVGAATGLRFMRYDDMRTYAWYCFCRALRYCATSLSNRDWMPLPVKNFQYGGSAVMCAAASQILYGLINAPTSFQTASYYRFLLTMGNIPAPMLKALSNTAFNLPLNMPDVVAHCAKAGLAVPAALTAADPAKGSRNLQSLFVSQVLTAGWSIPTHWAWFVADSFIYRTVIYYIPFNFTNVIVFQHPRIFKDPWGSLKTVVKGSVRGGLFLAVYCANTWAMVMLLSKYNLYTPALGYVLLGLVAGIATEIDSSSRRMELGIYCLSLALQSAYKMGIDSRLFRNVRGLEYHMFCASVSVILTMHQHRPQNIHGIMGSGMSYLVGLPHKGA